MKRECQRIADEIWECARAGQEPPVEVQKHVADCPGCAQAASEAGKVLELMREASRVGAFADCRPAVAARVSGGRARSRAVWAYACASAVLVGLLVGVFYIQHSRPVPKAAREAAGQTVTLPVEGPRADLKGGSGPSEIVPKREDAGARRIPPKRVERTTANRIRSVKKTTPIQARELPEPEPALEKGAPVTAVAVTWTSGESEPEDSYVSIYTDTETGERTICRVERSADSVNIYLESKPTGEKPLAEGV